MVCRGTAFHEASSSDLFDAPDALVWDAQSRTMVQVTGEVLYSEVAPVGLLFDVGGVTEHTIFNRVIDDRTHVFDGGGRGILNHGPVSRGGRVEFWGMFTHAFLHLFLCRLALGTPTTFASFLRDKLVEWSITSTGMSKIWVRRFLVDLPGSRRGGGSRSRRGLLSPFIGTPHSACFVNPVNSARSVAGLHAC